MLPDIDLKCVYDSENCSLVDDLMVPLLAQSNAYMRGVGFFTSGWLKLASAGILRLIENSGVAKIITSPILSKKDLDAFVAGEEARKSEILKEAIESSIDSLSVELESNVLNALSWLIADGLLEFRFAIPQEGSKGGDYHDKVGIFTDLDGNTVAIHGSLNDSLKGSLNGEAFSVFKSWVSGQCEYVQTHQKRLEQLWENKNKQFYSYDLPHASKLKLMQLRSDSRPYRLKHGEIALGAGAVDFLVEGIRLPIKLREYQGRAIRSWLKNGGQGILGMATGTGKTLTSLSSSVIEYLRAGKLALIVLVPYLHLLEQWAQDCRACGYSPILCSSEHGRWPMLVKSKIQDFNIGAIDNICILAVHDTASSEKFERATARLPVESSCLIADEVHNLGGSKLRGALLERYGKRLGLSATPRRWFDEEGTETIFKYFGGVCFEYSLEDAIGRFLTPYRYFPQLVNLSCEELERYESLTETIAKLSHLKTDGDGGPADRLKKCLLDRARLISGAENKLPVMIEIIRGLMAECKADGKELSHVLVYCAPGQHRDVLARLASLGLRCHEFVHNVKLAERHRLLGLFDDGKIQVLVAVKCLDEGVDVPSTKIAFFLASTSNPKEFVQRRGRVLRKAEGKKEAVLYDFFVVPDENLVPLKRDVDAGMLKREMPRFAEFSSVAENRYEARECFWGMLDSYDLLSLLDEKPWEVYQRMKTMREIVQVEEGEYV